MTWLDKVKRSRKSLTGFLKREEDDPTSHEEDRAFLRAMIDLTEAIEEVGRHARVPLTEWNADPEGKSSAV
jgi:hypothetical protein